MNISALKILALRRTQRFLTVRMDKYLVKPSKRIRREEDSLRSEDDVKGDKSKKKVQTKLKFLTWNISNFPRGSCVSASAPKDWSAQDSEEMMKALMSSHEPHVVTLQEAPQQDYDIGEDYEVASSQVSHCGYTILYVKKDLPYTTTSLPTPIVSTRPIPAAMAEIDLGHRRIWVAGVHLEPFNDADAKAARQAQLEAILNSMKAAKKPTGIILGDFNIREAEVKAYAKSGSESLGDLRDSGFPACKKLFTWDSRINKYHKDVSGNFAFAFTARFDRIMTTVGKNKSIVFDTDSAALVGSDPVSDNEEHFLSDHFGIVMDILIT
eukprot:m.343032 g.343032  ORF g.343032 m.343032 type:complete len:324 (+) comp22237_c0_seq1:149-1120(+)